MALKGQIFELDETQKKQLLLEYAIDDDGVAAPVVNNAPQMADEIEVEGVETEDDDILFPEDGEKFIRALPDEYHGSRMWAEVTE